MNYRELGRDDKALEAFEQCRAISASPEMTFYCTYQIAELHYRLQQYADASWAYQEAMQVDPHRLEPYHRLGRLLNEQARWEASRVWLEHAATLPPPMHGLNMESWVSAWGISFELAIARWWTGDRPGADRLFAAVLQRDDVPQRFKDACERNLALAKPSS
jgi:tetratricopeptide (TPR) repeat protein